MATATPHSAGTTTMTFIGSRRGSKLVLVRRYSFIVLCQLLIMPIHVDKVLRLLGQGMHGNVVSAVDLRDDGIVALKVCRGTPTERWGATLEVEMLKHLQKRAGNSVYVLSSFFLTSSFGHLNPITHSPAGVPPRPRAESLIY